jgi:fucose permease
MSFLLMGMLSALYGVALPVWSGIFGLAEGEGGTFLAVNSAGAFMAVLAGLLGLPILSLRLGLVLLASGLALIAPSWSWALTLAGGLVAGTGFGLLAAVVNRRFLSDFGVRGPGMLGIGNAISGLGAIASPLLLLLAGGQLGPIFWMTGAFAALSVALAPADPSAPPFRGLPNLRQPRVLILGFGLFAVAIEVSLTGFGASALIDLAFSEASAARLTSAFFVVYLATRLSLYWITRRVTPGTLVVVGLGGTAICIGVAALGAPAWGFVLAGGFVGITFPALFVWATDLLGSDPRMSSAILTLCLLGATLGPAALRPMLAALGEGAVFGIVAVVALMLTTIFAVVSHLVSRGP